LHLLYALLTPSANLVGCVFARQQVTTGKTCQFRELARQQLGLVVTTLSDPASSCGNWHKPGILWYVAPHADSHVVRGLSGTAVFKPPNKFFGGQLVFGSWPNSIQLAT
jgi:hypothetical protein